jgi:hypothetical protein
MPLTQQYDPIRACLRIEQPEHVLQLIISSDGLGEVSIPLPQPERQTYTCCG